VVLWLTWEWLDEGGMNLGRGLGVPWIRGGGLKLEAGCKQRGWGLDRLLAPLACFTIVQPSGLGMGSGA
jgi:hypothetical protein